MEKISISNGNVKMGKIPSVSLPPVVTCAKNCTCAKKCYAMKLCRIYKNVREAYSRNLDILTRDPSQYWEQIKDVLHVSRFFRFHVSGDIPDYEYFENMVFCATWYSHCEILVFTKKYEIINTYLEKWGKLPSNLHVIFSEWDGMFMPNPHNMPVAHVIFKGQTPANDWKICEGNCMECAKNGVNCWTLGRGEHIAFYEH